MTDSEEEDAVLSRRRQRSAWTHRRLLALDAVKIAGQNLKQCLGALTCRTVIHRVPAADCRAPALLAIRAVFSTNHILPSPTNEAIRPTQGYLICGFVLKIYLVSPVE